MPTARLHWFLIFTDSSLEHLAERGIEAEHVAEVVFGQHGPVRVRRSGRGSQERWYLVGPLAGGDLVTCVFRAGLPRDLVAEGAFVVPPTGVPEDPSQFHESMRLCVTAWLAADDEARGYRAWRRSKGGA